MYSYGSRSNSQACQDLFVLEMLKGKRNGTFLEIGANSATENSNSVVLETDFDWRGLLVEYDRSFEREYRQLRKSPYIIADARSVDYKDRLKDFPANIDYLQIDLEAENRSTLDVLEKLDREVFPEYKFATVTFEHDIYRGDFFDTRKISREIFSRNGYRLLFPDVSFRGNSFEDWYVHGDLVDYSTDTKADLPKDCVEIIKFIQGKV